MLAGAEQQGGEGEHEQFGAVALFRQVAVGSPGHAGGGVAPQADGLGGFPFHVADEDAVGEGGAAPVDAAGGVTGDEGAVLPEAVADADAAAAVDALGDGGGDALGRDEQGRQP